MTRTERNTSPAAIMRDRHSRTGLTKSEFERKGGAGAHNWGSINDEGRAEYDGELDARLETAQFEDGEGEDETTAEMVEDEDNAGRAHRVHDPSVQDIADRNPINELDSRGTADPQATSGGRRMSAVSDQERAEALRYREGGLKQNGVDLANIARTSYGIAQSPTDSSVLGTSPLRSKGGFAASG